MECLRPSFTLFTENMLSVVRGVYDGIFFKLVWKGTLKKTVTYVTLNINFSTFVQLYFDKTDASLLSKSLGENWNI